MTTQIKTAKLDVRKREYYKDTALIYPDQNIPVDKKTEEYHRMWCEKIYSLLQNNKTWITSDQKTSIEENRRWADGKQDTTFALDLIFGTGENPQKDDAFAADGTDVRDVNQTYSGRKAWEKLDTRPVSVAPKILTKINEHARAMYYEMSVRAIDSYSSAIEEKEKYSLWFYKENKKWIDTQRQIAGIGVTEPSFMPQNLDELELYAVTGGFKVPYSVSMEDLLKHTFEVSDWDKEVAEKVKKDLLTNGFAIVQETFDKEIKRVTVEYRDIAHTGLQYSSTKSFKNAEYGYHEGLVEVSLIRQRLGLSQEQASALAQSYLGQYGNPTSGQWNNYNTSKGEGAGYYLGFDSFKIPVFNCEWIDVDNEQYVSFEDKFGRKRQKNYKGELQENEQLMDNQIRYVRKCKWIVGTDYIFDWGKSEYIAKDKFGQPRLSYRGVMLSTTPIVPQIIPFLSGFQLAWIKAQHAIAQAIGNGFAVDIGAISQVAIGKDKSWDPMELLRFYKQSSFLVYKKTNSLSGFGRSASPPVIPLNNSSFENIRAQFEAMSKYLSLIETTSGISGVSTGEQADPDVAKFNMQISIQGTNEIINNVVRAVTDLQEDVSVNLCYRIRSYCHMNKTVADSYAQVIGEQRMKAVLDAEKNHVEYGISIMASDISEEKRNIMAMIQSFIAPGVDGKSHMAEGLVLLDQVHQMQNLRRIGLILGYLMEKKSEKEQEFKLASAKAQNDGLAQIEKQKHDAALQAQDFEFERIKRQGETDFIIKWGKTMAEVLGKPSDLQPQQPPQQPQMPMQPPQQMQSAMAPEQNITEQS